MCLVLLTVPTEIRCLQTNNSNYTLLISKLTQYIVAPQHGDRKIPAQVTANACEGFRRTIVVPYELYELYD